MRLGLPLSAHLAALLVASALMAPAAASCSGTSYFNIGETVTQSGYDDDATCTWTSEDVETFLKLEFSTLEYEVGYDSVEIRDADGGTYDYGQGSVSNGMQNFAPITICTNPNAVSIVLNSDGSVSGSGFTVVVSENAPFDPNACSNEWDGERFVTTGGTGYDGPGGSVLAAILSPVLCCLCCFVFLAIVAKGQRNAVTRPNAFPGPKRAGGGYPAARGTLTLGKGHGSSGGGGGGGGQAAPPPPGQAAPAPMYAAQPPPAPYNGGYAPNPPPMQAQYPPGPPPGAYPAPGGAGPGPGGFEPTPPPPGAGGYSWEAPPPSYGYGPGPSGPAGGPPGGNMGPNGYDNYGYSGSNYGGPSGPQYGPAAGGYGSNAAGAPPPGYPAQAAPPPAKAEDDKYAPSF